jgi:transposase
VTSIFIDKRAFQRVQAVFLVAQGRTITEVAEIAGVSQQTIYNWGDRKKAGEIYIRTACLGSDYNEIAKVAPMSQVVGGKGDGRGRSYIIDLP